MKKLMLYTLALPAAILCLPSCSEEEEVIGGPLPLSIQIFIQDAKGQDLLNETNEGALWKSDWKIDIDGVETPLSSKDRPTQLGFEKPADSTPGYISCTILGVNDNQKSGTITIKWSEDDNIRIEYNVTRKDASSFDKCEYYINGNPYTPESKERIVIVKE